MEIANVHDIKEKGTCENFGRTEEPLKDMIFDKKGTSEKSGGTGNSPTSMSSGKNRTYENFGGHTRRHICDMRNIINCDIRSIITATLVAL